jgi:asparagine synthetase B (glutamine-hydrolysing)
VHPSIPQTRIAAWCLELVTEQRYAPFRELLGNFVIIVDEPSQRRVTFITDMLGVRPLFMTKAPGRLLFGSEVWPIHRTGLIGGYVNYDAVSAWIAYRYNCTDGSLFGELQKTPSGSATVWQDGQRKTTPYVQWQESSHPLTTDQVAEDLHEIVSSNIKMLLANYSRTTLALSGGYDSRYLLALASSISNEPIQCVTVAVTPEEDFVARQVAQAVGASHKRIAVKNSEWDLYDEVFLNTPDGFPISRNLTYLIAQEYPGIPMLTGFMGDSLMRGSRDTILGKDETHWKHHLARALQLKHLAIYPQIFREEIAHRIQDRALLPMEEAIRKGSEARRIIFWADTYYRQRCYISMNFVQNLGLTEALMPFYSWRLLEYKLSHEPRLFHREIYKSLFRKHFPELSKLPHADELPKHMGRQTRIATCTKTWSRRLLAAMCNKNELTLLSKKYCLPRVLAGIAGVSRAEGLVHTVQRLYSLEKQAKKARLGFDWECI